MWKQEGSYEINDPSPGRNRNNCMELVLGCERQTLSYVLVFIVLIISDKLLKYLLPFKVKLDKNTYK